MVRISVRSRRRERQICHLDLRVISLLVASGKSTETLLTSSVSVLVSTVTLSASCSDLNLRIYSIIRIWLRKC
jgi:hypothetical protein